MYSPQTNDVFTATKYSNPPLEVYGSSNCHKTTSTNIAEAKMMIINNHWDAILIDTVRITLTSGLWYEFNRFWDSNNNRQNYICVDNEWNDCDPYKQISYFDLSQPYKTNGVAQWGDGTYVYPDIITCDPTPNPTSPTRYPTPSPTPSPTLFPTPSPTPSPTLFPTPSPTTFPTLSPTMHPTPSPTTFPTVPPSHAPTADPTTPPTAFPTAYPSDAPTADPTTSPSIDPTVSPSDSPTTGPTDLHVVVVVPEHTTFISTVSPITASTLTVEASDGDSDDNFLDINVYSVQFYIIAGSANLVICICVTVLICVCKKRKRKRKNRQSKRIRETVASQSHLPNVDKEIASKEVALGRVRPRDERLIQKWLKIKVDLPQYLDNFVENGYHNINMIRVIKDRDTLVSIGVAKPGHQAALLSEIKKLRSIARRKKRTKKKKKKKEEKGAEVPNLRVQHSINKVIPSKPFEIPGNVTMGIQSDSEGDTDELGTDDDDDDDDDEMLQNLDDWINGKGETKGGHHDEGMRDDEFIVEDEDDLTPKNENDAQTLGSNDDGIYMVGSNTDFGYDNGVIDDNYVTPQSNDQFLRADDDDVHVMEPTLFI